MEAAKYRIMGSDYVGVFASVTDKYLFGCPSINQHGRQMMSEKLGAKYIEIRLSGSDLVGLFSKANSNGIILSNLTLDQEVETLKAHRLGINIGVMESELNALGSNVLANDRIAIINPDYSHKDEKEIGDVLGVETVRAHIGGFKTVGANNILTNKGFVINNKATDEEKAEFDRITGFDSVRSTANTGGLAVGLSAIANHNGVIAGDGTTGYELARIVDALE